MLPLVPLLTPVFPLRLHGKNHITDRLGATAVETASFMVNFTVKGENDLECPKILVFMLISLLRSKPRVTMFTLDFDVSC